MGDLEKKFEKELGPDARVIACRFPLPSHKPDEIADHGIDTVWVYEHFGRRRENSNSTSSSGTG